NSLSFEPQRNYFPIPDLNLHITNRVQYALVDKSTGRILDFVNLDHLISALDFTRNLVGNTDQLGTLPGEATNRLGMFWITNRLGNSTVITVPTVGITNQIYASLTTNFLSEAEWRDYSRDLGGQSASDAIKGFRNFLGMEGRTNITSSTVMQVPFTPTRQLHQELTWQAN